MRYSFTRAREKRLVSAEMRLVLFFFGVTLLMLGGTYGFLVLKTYGFENEIARLDAKSVELNASISQMNMQIAFVENEAGHAEGVYTANTVLKESIKNLFDLVPDRIILSQAKLDSDALVLYGTTPNKEVYEFMLHAPLRSIFHRTYSSFYPMDNGWYRFVSTNYLDEEVTQ